MSVVFLAGLALGAASAPAGEGNLPPPPQPGQKLSPKSLVPPTVPDSKTVEKDTDEAVGAIEQRGRDEKLIRESVKTPNRRPDLDHDVEQGIQSRNVEKALRGR